MIRPLASASLVALVLTAALARADELPDLPGSPRPDFTRCATSELRESYGPFEIPGAIRAGLPCGHTPVGPPPNPGIGTSWDWYIWRLNGFPEADLKSCTIRGMGDHCYVVVEDSQWNVNIDQAQVDTIVDHMENQSIGDFPAQGIWDLNTAYFGDPPNLLDDDERVYVLYYDFDVNADGYFWGFDQECDDVAQFHSNECDVVYMNCSDFDPAGSYLLAVLAHEFEHLIHFNYDPNEAAWVDEGMAELAMWLYGDPDDISQFNTAPDRSLTTFQGAWSDYIKSYLFSLYFFERYGGQAAVRALVAEPANSILGFDNTLDAFLYSEDFVEVFSDWVVANWLDDPTIGDGRFGYVGETLPPFQAFFNAVSYPVGPSNTTVNHWAADYARFPNDAPIVASFDGVDNTTFAVRAILKDTVNPTEIVDMSLDALQAGTLALPELGDTHDEAVLVYAGTNSGGGTGYQYGATIGAVDAQVGTAAANALSLTAIGSGSARPSIVYSVPSHASGQPVRLDVYDVSGRLVRRVLDGEASAGRFAFVWSEAAEPAASGVYFVSLTVGAETLRTRVVIVR